MASTERDEEGESASGSAAATNPFSTPRHASDVSDPYAVSAGDNLDLAELSSRLWASIIDVSLIAGVGVLAAIAIPNFVRAGTTSNDTLVFALGGLTALYLLSVVVLQCYFLVRDGQSLGKKAAGIRIVDAETGKNPGFFRVIFLRIFINHLLGYIPFVGPFYSFGDILYIFGSERRCLHDRLANTIVVKVR